MLKKMLFSYFQFRLILLKTLRIPYYNCMFVNMFEENNEFARDAHFEISVHLTSQWHIRHPAHTLEP